MPLDSTTYVPSRQAKLAEQAQLDAGPYKLRKAQRSLEYVLNNARVEVPLWLEALRAGRIDGNRASGECCCLLGTIAKARGRKSCWHLTRPATWPIEAFIVRIHPGHTPENHPVAALVAEWTEDWIARNGGGV